MCTHIITTLRMRHTLPWILQYSAFHYDHFPFAEVIKSLFTKIHFSEAGTNERNVEEATYMLFMDFLRDCEGTHDNCILVKLVTPHIIVQMVKFLV